MRYEKAAWMMDCSVTLFGCARYEKAAWMMDYSVTFFGCAKHISALCHGLSEHVFCFVCFFHLRDNKVSYAYNGMSL